MADNSQHHETHKLIRCHVTNKDGNESVRLVEIEAFKMWEYLMVNKHGLTVSDPMLCLWLSEGEYQSNASIFERSGTVESVSRIVVDIFDTEYGFSHNIERYAMAGETESVIGILRSHIPEHIDQKDACHIDVISGYIVQQWHHSQARPVIMGLEG